jgi:hypothetical protein
VKEVSGFRACEEETLRLGKSLICGYGVVATQEFSKLLSSVQIRVSAYKYFKKNNVINYDVKIAIKN